MKRRQPVNKAFTLIELLVVISIIALLIAILIPSLANARRQAKTVADAANQRGIARGALTYASEWNDAIVGSGSTTGGALYKDAVNGITNPSFTSLNPPPVVQVFDWVSPLSPYLNISYPFNGPFNSANYRLTMFETQRRAKILTCPLNEFQAGPYTNSSPKCSTGPMPSYSMGMLFVFTSGFKEDGNVNGLSSFVTIKNGYRPKVGLVGNTSQKIFLADGARYCTTAIAPDIDLTSTSSTGQEGSGLLGGAYADWGSFSKYSKAWDRGLAPGNGNPNGGAFDARFYAFRHGKSERGGRAGSFKINATFFDGHVELMDDLKFSDPSLWCPSGEVIPTKEMSTDVANTYAKGRTELLIP